MAHARKKDSDRGDLAADIRRAYEDGASIQQLAAMFGKTQDSIRHLLAGHRAASEGDQREEAHRLVDQVPEDRVPEATDLLRNLMQAETTEQPRRRFRTVGIFEGEPDLGRRAKDIARHELGGRSGKSA